MWVMIRARRLAGKARRPKGRAGKDKGAHEGLPNIAVVAMRLAL